MPYRVHSAESDNDGYGTAVIMLTSCVEQINDEAQVTNSRVTGSQVTNSRVFCGNINHCEIVF